MTIRQGYNLAEFIGEGYKKELGNIDEFQKSQEIKEKELAAEEIDLGADEPFEKIDKPIFEPNEEDTAPEERLREDDFRVEENDLVK